MTFTKSFIKKPPFFITDFQCSCKVLLFEKLLLCGNFLQCNGGPLNIPVPLNISCILPGSLFSLLVVFCAVFYCYRDIKMGHSSFGAIWKKLFCSSLPFFISNILGNIFGCSFISESKSWDGLIFV